MRYVTKLISYLFLASSSVSQFIPDYSGADIFASSNATVFPKLEDAGSPDLFVMPLCGTFKLEEATINQMQSAMSNGTLTSVQLCLCYLQRALQTQNYLK